MGKTIDIGGRIHNPEVGNVVTGANEILDDTKNKKQDVINSEVDAALEALDANKQDNLTFDQIPTEDSTNPVTSGGVYAADLALQQAIEAMLTLIPSAASALNQLADKSFVNSSIATASATFRGTYNLVSDLHLSVTASHQDIATALASAVSTADNNDYCFVQIPTSDTSSDIRVTERYKFNGTAWAYEYDLNNSGFTATQWEAINSGITALLVQKLGALPTAAELATSLAGKQNVLTFDNVPTSGSDNPVKSGGLYQLFAAIDAKMPSDASANNKLVAENRLAAYVTAIIEALDASFDVTSTDGHVTFRITQTNGQIASVQILTSDIASASALTTLGGRVSTNETDIANLQAAYAGLTQSDVIVGTLPSSGQQQNKIYRQPDQDHTPPQFYSDYMWNGTTWVLMATYNNAIDTVPTAGSHNLVESGGISEYITSNFFTGKGNGFVYCIIRNLIPNTTYKIRLDKNSISHSQVTGDGYGFSIRSYDGNGAITNIVIYTTAQYNNIPEWLVFTTPSSMKYIEVGGQVDNGTKVRFGIYHAPFCINNTVYFTNAKSPEFRVTTDGWLKVVLPAETMRIYREGGLTIEKSLSGMTEEQRTFILSTGQNLLYNKTTGNILMQPYASSISDEYIVLLGLFGDLKTNAANVSGALYGYYINSCIVNPYYNEKNIFAYFTYADYPTFEIVNSVLNVKLPSNRSLCLYNTFSGNAKEINLSTYTSPFEIGSGYRLLYDYDSNTIYTEPSTTIHNYGRVVVLLTVLGDITTKTALIGGLLAPYYFAHLEKGIDYKLKEIDGGVVKNTKNTSDMKFAFFSDVHAGWKNVERIIDYATKEGLDCIINGGDTVSSVIGDGISDYNNLVGNSSVPILNTAGNHDCWQTSAWNWANLSDIYNFIYAKVAETTEIVQPSGACYYYKDFGNIRVISILSMSTGTDPYYDSTQNTWLAGVLEDARTKYHYWKISSSLIAEPYTLQQGDEIKGTLVNDADLNNYSYDHYNAGEIYAVPMSVMILTHCPFKKEKAVRVESNKINSWLDYRDGCIAKGINFDELSLSELAVSTVSDYINNGGSFICWLTGHVHVDNILTHLDDNNQLMININSAKYNLKPDGVTAQNELDPSYDSFDMIGIDLRSGMIKIQRVGWHMDSSMRKRESLCYNFVKKELISEN